MQLGVLKRVLLLVGEPLAVVVDKVAQSGDPLRRRKDLHHGVKQPLHAGDGRVSRASVRVRGGNTPITAAQARFGGEATFNLGQPSSPAATACRGPGRGRAVRWYAVVRREARRGARWERGAGRRRETPCRSPVTAMACHTNPLRRFPRTHSAGSCSDMAPPSSCRPRESKASPAGKGPAQKCRSPAALFVTASAAWTTEVRGGGRGKRCSAVRLIYSVGEGIEVRHARARCSG